MAVVDRLLAIKPAAILDIVGFVVVVLSQVSPLAEAAGLELSRPTAFALALSLLVLREMERRLTRNTQIAALETTPPDDERTINALRSENSRLRTDNAALKAAQITQGDTLPGYVAQSQTSEEAP